MPKSFSLKFPARGGGSIREPKAYLRVIVGVLAFANVVAAFLVFKPPGGSAEDLERELSANMKEQKQRKASIERLKVLASKSATARAQGDDFIDGYFLGRRTASSTMVSELLKAANEAKIKPKEHAFQYEPVEGSDDMSTMIVTGAYEGTYADLIHFIHRLDRSQRFLIMDSLSATPQTAQPGMLSVSLKMITFVRDDGGVIPEEEETAASPAAESTPAPSPTQPIPKIIPAKPLAETEPSKPQTQAAQSLGEEPPAPRVTPPRTRPRPRPRETEEQ